MKAIQNNEFHEILLRIYKAFQVFCIDNNIPFFVGGGTAIGAVRHKGFIPWDDDMDLFIYKRDFPKLLALAEMDPFIDAEKRYKVLLPGVFPNYYPFFKIVDTKTVVYEKNVSKKYSMGVWLDLFCLSFWDEDEKKAIKQCKREKIYEKMNQLIIGGDYCESKYKLLGFFAVPVRLIFLLLGMDSSFWCKKILDNDYCNKGTFVGNVCWPFSFEKEHYREEWYRELICIPFEDTTCLIAKEYDKVLRQFYGDYMVLPPKEKRIRHDAEAFYLE